MKIYLVELQAPKNNIVITIEAPNAGTAIIGAMQTAYTLPGIDRYTVGIEQLITCEEIKINSIINPN